MKLVQIADESDDGKVFEDDSNPSDRDNDHSESYSENDEEWQGEEDDDENEDDERDEDDYDDDYDDDEDDNDDDDEDETDYDTLGEDHVNPDGFDDEDIPRPPDDRMFRDTETEENSNERQDKQKRSMTSRRLLFILLAVSLCCCILIGAIVVLIMFLVGNVFEKEIMSLTGAPSLTPTGAPTIAPTLRPTASPTVTPTEVATVENFTNVEVVQIATSYDVIIPFGNISSSSNEPISEMPETFAPMDYQEDLIASMNVLAVQVLESVNGGIPLISNTTAPNATTIGNELPVQDAIRNRLFRRLEITTTVFVKLPSAIAELEEIACPLDDIFLGPDVTRCEKVTALVELVIKTFEADVGSGNQAPVDGGPVFKEDTTTSDDDDDEDTEGDSYDRTRELQAKESLPFVGLMDGTDPTGISVNDEDLLSSMEEEASMIVEDFKETLFAAIDLGLLSQALEEVNPLSNIIILGNSETMMSSSGSP